MVAVFGDGVDGEGLGVLPVVPALEGIAVFVEEAAVGADPEAASGVFKDGADEAVAEAFGGGVDLDGCAVDAEEAAAFGAGPEVAVVGDGEAKDAVDGGELGATGFKERHAGAVELGEAAGGADPELTLGGFDEGLDGVLREAVGDAPDGAGIRRGLGRGGLAGDSGRREQREGQRGCQMESHLEAILALIRKVTAGGWEPPAGFSPLAGCRPKVRSIALFCGGDG